MDLALSVCPHFVGCADILMEFAAFVGSGQMLLLCCTGFVLKMVLVGALSLLHSRSFRPSAAACLAS